MRVPNHGVWDVFDRVAGIDDPDAPLSVLGDNDVRCKRMIRKHVPPNRRSDV